MLFNIYDYDNQLLEQIEARDIIEAWFKARSLYGNVLDVRPLTEAITVGKPGIYRVDGIDVTIQYISPGIHEISFMAPDKISEETLTKIDELIKKVIGRIQG